MAGSEAAGHLSPGQCYNFTMQQSTTPLDFGDSRKPTDDFVLFDRIIEDRGSRYSVSIGKVTSRQEIKDFLTRLKSDKKYAKATHNSWAARITHDGAIYETKNDDGETGAGMVILRVMQKENITDAIICVTRWFGGVKLMNDRYKHIQDSAIFATKNI